MSIVPSRRTLFAALALALSLAACGGGLSLGIDIGGGDGDLGPPSVSLASAQDSVAAGASVTLVAAASDENGIDEVAFYRLDGDRAVWLGSDLSEPYAWDATAPTDGRRTLRVFARATDGAGSRADSAVVSIAVTP